MIPTRQDYEQAILDYMKRPEAGSLKKWSCLSVDKNERVPNGNNEGVENSYLLVGVYNSLIERSPSAEEVSKTISRMVEEGKLERTNMFERVSITSHRWGERRVIRYRIRDTKQ
jgi:hypothetical protein